MSCQLPAISLTPEQEERVLEMHGLLLNQPTAAARLIVHLTDRVAALEHDVEKAIANHAGDLTSRGGMSEPLSSEQSTYAERVAEARNTGVGDRWQKRKQPEHWAEVLSTDGVGNLRLRHWNGRVTCKWANYLASDYERVPEAKDPKARPARCDYDEGPSGDLPFTIALNSWQYSEIERLLQDLARYENAHKVLVSENKRLQAELDESTSVNQSLNLLVIDLRAQQAGDGT